MMHPLALVLAGLVVCILVESLVWYLVQFRKVARVRS
jgi:hypothetical protein